LELAPRVFQKLHEAIQRGYIRACHDLSEGGLATALAEMCLAGDWGADVEISRITAGNESGMSDEVVLFSESNTRFLIEVPKDRESDLDSLFSSVPCLAVGTVTNANQLRIFGRKNDDPMISASVDGLREAWQTPLRW
jgi:phosphoribosylformylglycinamidine synthase